MAAARNNVPAVSWQPPFARDGGLLCYGPDLVDNFLSDEQLKQLETIVRALHKIEGDAQVAKRLLNLDGPLNKS